LSGNDFSGYFGRSGPVGSIFAVRRVTAVPPIAAEATEGGPVTLDEGLHVLPNFD
jgi:hypothetical protein